MKKPVAPPRKPHSYADYQHVQALITKIKNGYLPSASEVRLSSTFQHDDIERDIAATATDILFTVQATDFVALKALSEGMISLDLLRDARDACKGHEAKDKFQVYLAALGDHASVLTETMRTIDQDFTSTSGMREGVYHVIFALGCIGLGVGRNQPIADADALRVIGLERLKELERIASAHTDCVGYNLGLRDDAPVTGEDLLYAALKGKTLQAVEEDRAEFNTTFEPEDVPIVLETKRVVPSIDLALLPTSRKDAFRGILPIAGIDLPVPAAPAKLGDWCLAMIKRFPHLSSQIERIAITLGTSDSVSGLRLLLVGPPGGGKTSFAQGVFEELQVPNSVFPCAGAHDSSFAGTSAQWSSARPSYPLQQIAMQGCAGIGIVLDEIDKIGTGSHNGNLADALLGFLEPTTSRKMLDPLVEQSVDLSAVNWIATANDIDNVPRTLRSRFQVIQIQGGEWKQVGMLASMILKRISRDHYVPFAQDEIEVLGKVWKGGDLRQLERCVERLMRARDQAMARH